MISPGPAHSRLPSGASAPKVLRGGDYNAKVKGWFGGAGNGSTSNAISSVPSTTYPFDAGPSSPPRAPAYGAAAAEPPMLNEAGFSDL